MIKIKQRKRNRKYDFDYSLDNLYFVTSCVQDRVCCFGEVTNKQMILNQYGKIAHEQFHWLTQQYPFILLHAFVVMPNHVHAIIEINRNAPARAGRVGTGLDLSLRSHEKILSLSKIMGAYKTTSSKKIHLLGNTKFAWQRSFHDHIIRNEYAFEKISNYIINNPTKWADDTFNR